MLDGVGEAIGAHFQRCQVFHTHVQHLRIFEQRDPHLSQLESHKPDSSDGPIRGNRCWINRKIGVFKGLVNHAQSIAPQKWHSERILVASAGDFITTFRALWLQIAWDASRNLSPGVELGNKVQFSHDETP
ncbi:hypothetical protein AVEN_131832-1 [Araneus ventricosus]|uniref:Uncharacterized protein n=1 Tax=Araneus ventricosus TaxID=182803 RepID=A0A4Y2NM05_ARAVE|nr:hypothetical protein AVEN_131832-1 [Araneus ventricosus]